MVVDGVVTAGREVTEKMASHDARAGSGIRRVASRGVLHDLLTDVDHYEVTEVSTEAVALAYLAACPEGVVTVCSNSHPDHHLSTACFAAVVADKRLAQRHQYILLSTNPSKIPVALRADLRRLLPAILPKPFDLDVLLTTVRGAASRLVLMRPA
jgi:hypothetical protein